MAPTNLSENFFTTREAANRSGYTTDYLARMVREKQIEGTRVGRSWLIDKESFARFLEDGNRRKSPPVRKGSVEFSYAEDTSKRSKSSAQSFPEPPRSERILSGGSPWYSHAIAVLAAIAVLVSASTVATSSELAVAVRHAGSLAAVAGEGFQSAFGSVPNALVERYENVAREEVDARKTVAETVRSSTAYAVSEGLQQAGEAAVAFSGVDSDASDRALSHSRMVAYGNLSSWMAHAPAMPSPQDLQKALTPNAIAQGSLRAYEASGAYAYGGIVNLFSAYNALIQDAGGASLEGAGIALANLKNLSGFITTMNLALGNGVINTSHAVLDAEVALAYGFAIQSPVVVEKSAIAIATVGDTVVRIAAVTPHATAQTYLALVAAPSRLAPEVARIAWGVQYRAAEHFVAATQTLTTGYLALIEGTGIAAYNGTVLAARVPALVETSPAVAQLAAVLLHNGQSK